MLISIVIRTLNEDLYLQDLLTAISRQKLPSDWTSETVLVDSGSTDRTLEIARQNQCRITYIKKEDFSFGRSLNIGCEFANGEILVFVSGHCIPTDEYWLENLITPLASGACSYSYGRQLGNETTKFSENRVFLKYYPAVSFLPQEGFFANNANAAMPKCLWHAYPFDEALTGLEDMHLAKRLVAAGYLIGYAADAGVYHIHDESWRQVMNRFEREGAALTEIMPETGLRFVDFIECTIRSIAKDSYAAIREGRFIETFFSICAYRFLQYWGSYRGTRFARMIASMRRKAYFHPDRHLERTSTNESYSTASDESPQQQSTREKFQANRW